MEPFNTFTQLLKKLLVYIEIMLFNLKLKWYSNYTKITFTINYIQI